VATIKPLYFNDIKIGQKFTTSTYEFTKSNIIEFAKQFDPQPFHLNEDSGKASIFGGLVASGWHIGSATMRLIIGNEAPIAGGLISRGGEVKWLNPARPGDVIHVESEVIDKIPSKSNPNKGTVLIQSKTINQNNYVIQILVANLIAHNSSENS
jgi:acyl dehydratase